MVKNSYLLQMIKKYLCGIAVFLMQLNIYQIRKCIRFQLGCYIQEITWVNTVMANQAARPTNMTGAPESTAASVCASLMKPDFAMPPGR